MESSFFDVAVVGGGPAGSATALSLQTHALSLSQVLIEATNYDACRIGETLPPPTRTVLEHLQVWDSFCALEAREVFGTTSAWGHATPIDNDFIFMPASTGWHVDRARFDNMLATAAEKRGAKLYRQTSVRAVERVNDQWRLNLSTGGNITTRFIVDATGGKAAIACRLGARFKNLDQLVGIARFFDDDSNDARLLIEAFEYGWWYTAGLPNGKRIISCVTDSDLARRIELNQPEEWERRLAGVPAISSVLRECKPCGDLVARSAASRLLEPVATETWLAVGDAASRFDPLSSQGIFKALRSGVFASYAIGDWLTRNDASGLQRYRRYISKEFVSYCETRSKYYGQEQRWPASPFWLRRIAEPEPRKSARERLAIRQLPGQ
jgi:flavin-dependent dehydrogenase